MLFKHMKVHIQNKKYNETQQESKFIPMMQNDQTFQHWMCTNLMLTIDTRIDDIEYPPTGTAIEYMLGDNVATIICTILFALMILVTGYGYLSWNVISSNHVSLWEESKAMTPSSACIKYDCTTKMLSRSNVAFIPLLWRNQPSTTVF
jgi:hypothetical protein